MTTDSIEYLLDNFDSFRDDRPTNTNFAVYPKIIILHGGTCVS